MENQNINCVNYRTKKINLNYIMMNQNNININQFNENIKMENQNNNSNYRTKNNLSTNYIMTSRKSILKKNNRKITDYFKPVQRSKPVAPERENNLTKEEVKEKLVIESKKIKQLLNKLINEKIKKYKNEETKLGMNKVKKIVENELMRRLKNEIIEKVKQNNEKKLMKWVKQFSIMENTKEKHLKIYLKPMHDM